MGSEVLLRNDVSYELSYVSFLCKTKQKRGKNLIQPKMGCQYDKN